MGLLSVYCFFLQTVFRNPQATKAYAIPFPDRLNVPAAEVRVTQDALVTIDMEVPCCHVAVHRWHANTPDGKGNPFYFQHGRLGVTPSSGALVRMFRVSADVDEDSRYPKVMTRRREISVRSTTRPQAGQKMKAKDTPLQESAPSSGT